jgi:hypothetical protein
MSEERWVATGILDRVLIGDGHVLIGPGVLVERTRKYWIYPPGGSNPAWYGEARLEINVRKDTGERIALGRANYFDVFLSGTIRRFHREWRPIAVNSWEQWAFDSFAGPNAYSEGVVNDSGIPVLSGYVLQDNVTETLMVVPSDMLAWVRELEFPDS